MQKYPKEWARRIMNVLTQLYAKETALDIMDIIYHKYQIAYRSGKKALAEWRIWEASVLTGEISPTPISKLDPKEKKPDLLSWLMKHPKATFKDALKAYRQRRIKHDPKCLDPSIKWHRATYEMVARIIKLSPIAYDDKKTLSYLFAIEFKRDNELFNHSKFYSACGVD